MRRDILRGDLVTAISISLLFLLFYVYFQSSSIFGGDAGDLVSAALVGGNPHPPSYPLFTLLAQIALWIPYSTHAWRVGLISSTTMSLGMGVLYLILREHKNSSLISITTTAFVGFSYLVWLYAIVPEVFGLHILLSLILIFMVQLFIRTKKNAYLCVAAFIFGLGIAHHHTIVFLVPGLLSMVWKNIPKIIGNKRLLLKVFLCTLVGVLPYVYTPLAASYQPPINWENPTTLPTFIRVVTRAIYGTFRSGNGFGTQNIDRVIQLRLFWDFLLLYATRLGILLGGVGFIYEFFWGRRQWLNNFILFLFIGPLFIFYAGFPVVLNFYVATSERFFILPFIIFSLWIASGITALVKIIIRYLPLQFKLDVLVSLVFLIYPLVIFALNMPKMNALRNDQTAERLAYDIFNTMEPNAAVFIADDTSVFNAQYVYYSSKPKYSSVKLLSFGSLGYDYYTQILRYQYPELALNKLPENTQISDYLLATMPSKFPVYSMVRFSVPEEYVWVPYGLMYKLVLRTTINDAFSDALLEKNDTLFDMYQDPLSGALSVYRHAMLSDVLRVYGNAYRQFGYYLLSKSMPKESEKYLLKAYEYQPSLVDTSLQLAISYLEQKKCDDAIKTLNTAQKQYVNEPNIYKLLSVAYGSCLHDTEAGRKYEEEYIQKSKKSKIQLDDF